MTISSDGKQDGSRIVQYVAGITVNLGIICSEMHHGWPSPLFPILLKGNYFFTISREESLYLTIIPFIGGIVGAIITWSVIDNCGRQKILTYSSLPFIASWLLVGVARTSVLMFIGRFLAGISISNIYIVVPLYLNEIADTTTKNHFSYMSQISAVFGWLLINVLGTPLRLDTVAYLASCLPILLLLFFSYMPESPYFCLMKNDSDGARISLQTLRGRREISDELEWLTETTKEDKANPRKFSDLVTIKSNRQALFVALGLRGFQQLCGISAIVFYCQLIFEQSKSIISPYLSTTIFFCVNLLFSALSSFLIDFFGRRPLLIISTTGTTLALLSHGVHLYLKNCTDIKLDGLDFIPILSLLGFITVFSLGLNSIPVVMVEELFPNSVKPFAFCVLNLYYNVLVIFIATFFYWSTDKFGMHVPFLVFAGSTFVGTIFFIFFAPETKRKTFENVREDFSETGASELKS